MSRSAGILLGSNKISRELLLSIEHGKLKTGSSPGPSIAEPLLSAATTGLGIIVASKLESAYQVVSGITL
jgi:hypothetical protein